MITPENLHQVLGNLSVGEIQSALEAKKDYLQVNIHISNSGFYTEVQSFDYDDELCEETMNKGNMFIDQGEFERLLEECETPNYLKYLNS